jgi:adenylosuccinate synthase
MAHRLKKAPKYKEQVDRWLRPVPFIKKDFNDVYKKNKIELGSLQNKPQTARPNTVCIVGAQFGDEGKGRFVDNTIQKLLKNKGIKKVYVIRYQGGANAGHTVYTKKGVKLPLHQVPSSVLEKKAVGVMDRGMVINMEDVKTEIEDAEKLVGTLQGKLILSEEALLNTDLERAMEVLNRVKSGGNSKGGTTRGIGPTYADRYARLGFFVKDFFTKDWEELFTKKYERYQKEFKAYNVNLAEMEIPDLRATRDKGKAVTRTVGSKKEFLKRLKTTRDWYIKREKNAKEPLVQNTFLLYTKIFEDKKIGVIFEGAQAVGLHPWLGRFPDVTASDTTADGITVGTAVFKTKDVEETVGVLKISYMSSVGEARMITFIDLPRTEVTSTKKFTKDQLYGLKVREAAHERGTTTGRYRDICFLDLAMMRYNVRVGGISGLACTHLDIAWEDEPIKVCTHYLDKKGKYIPYQPGVEYQKNAIPQYIELPGWDGEQVHKAKSLKELPKNALKYLSFVQKQIGVPIVAITNGPERKHLIEIA